MTIQRRFLRVSPRKILSFWSVEVDDARNSRCLLRNASSAFLRSSMSTSRLYHRMICPDASRRGSPREWNQRHSPSARRTRFGRQHLYPVPSMTSTSGTKRVSHPRHFQGLACRFETSLRQFDTDDPPHDTHKVFQFNRITREPEVGVPAAFLHTDRSFEWMNRLRRQL